MALADRQRLLARLATDAPLRDRLAADPAALAAALGLDPADAAWLAALPRDPLDGFAGSLIAKRRGEVGKLLPLTARALGPVAFAGRFREHAARPIPDGRHVADAIAFTATVGLGPDDPPWLADLARLEASNLRAHHDPARRWTTCRLGHRPADLSRAAMGPDPGETPPRRPTLVVWLRITRQAQPRRIELSTIRLRRSRKL